MRIMFRLHHHDANLAAFVAQAGRLLGEEAELFDLDYEVELRLQRLLVPEQSCGLMNAAEIRRYSGPVGKFEVDNGLHRQRWPLPEGDLRIVKVSPPGGTYLYAVWAVAKRDVSRLQTALARLTEEAIRQVAPVLAEDVLNQLRGNTIDFLKRDEQLLRKYRVPKKRGLLLRGRPGNGKTMACRWLRYLCAKEDFAFQTVNASMYEEARSRHAVAELFAIDRPGLILFDDFDHALRHREGRGDEQQNVFLSELDGMTPKQGVVYLFTTNLTLDDIDPAAQRPGRIDVVLHFENPTRALRMRFFRDHWPEELRSMLDEEQFLNETEKWSFAELEEVRKAAVLRWVDGLPVDWHSLRGVDEPRSAASRARVVGFGAMHTASNEVIGPAAVHSARPRRC